MKLFVKLGNVTGFEKISRQQLRNIFSVPSSQKPVPALRRTNPAPKNLSLSSKT